MLHSNKDQCELTELGLGSKTSEMLQFVFPPLDFHTMQILILTIPRLAGAALHNTSMFL